MINRMELLRIIQNDARLTPDNIAIMLDCDVAEVEAELSALSNEKIILGYSAQIDWEKMDKDNVVAMIEVRITPMRNKGFDYIADILCKNDKVTACYLMSGGFDLMLIYEDKNLRDVASFVSDKIAPLDGVLSTTTHFILKKYKSNGIIFEKGDTDDSQAVIL